MSIGNAVFHGSRSLYKEFCMADKKIHIIITGEDGNGRAVAVGRNTLRNLFVIAVIASACLVSGTLAALKYYHANRELAEQTRILDTKLARISEVLSRTRAERDQLAIDREELLETSISRLDEKSKVIQEVMDQIGIEIKVEDDPDHSGGPFIADERQYGELLLEQTDRYLEVIRQMPLGRPVPGRISSKYGRRTDPLVRRKAFHPGIDFRGRTGDRIRATGDAIVKKVGRNNILGRHVILSHGNGYETIFAHMSKTLVNKGEKIQRGQVIGLIGNTGRSTGSHLHYGIRRNGKSIDPMKYLRVADISLTVNR